MKTSYQRIQNYGRRMFSTQIDPTLAAKNASAMSNFTDYELDFYPNQVAMRVILNDAGVLPTSIGGYEAFHGKLFHLSKVCDGTALVAAANNLVDVWSDTQHLGASAAATLTKIAVDVYHISGLSTP